MGSRALGWIVAFAALTACGELGPFVEYPSFEPVPPGGGARGVIRILNQDDVSSMVIDADELPAPFLWEGGPERALGEIPARSAREIPVWFNPTELGEYEHETVLMVRTGSKLYSVTVQLRGTADDEAPCGQDPCVAERCGLRMHGSCSWSLETGNDCTPPPPEALCRVPTWSTATLDFGQVQPDSFPVVRAIEFHNALAEPVELSGITVIGSDQFAVVPPPNGDPRRLKLWPGITTPLNLAFTPSSTFGLRSAELQFVIELPGRPRAAIRLEATVAGPDIEVSPTSLSFGTVEAFPYAATTTTRRLVIRNVGTAAPGGENLLLGKLDTEGNVIPGTQLSITYEDGTSVGAFHASFSDPFAPALGLSPTPGQNAVEVTVTFRASWGSLGEKRAELQIWSNDPDEPVTRIPLEGAAVEPPDCMYSVMPGVLDFGSVPLGGHAFIDLKFQNLAPPLGAHCTIYSAWITNGGDYFSLEGVELPVTIPGGEAKSLLVRANAVPVTANAWLWLLVSSKSAPEAKVQLIVRP